MWKRKPIPCLCLVLQYSRRTRSKLAAPSRQRVFPSIAKFSMHVGGVYNRCAPRRGDIRRATRVRRRGRGDHSTFVQFPKCLGSVLVRPKNRRTTDQNRQIKQVDYLALARSVCTYIVYVGTSFPSVRMHVLHYSNEDILDFRQM